MKNYKKIFLFLLICVASLLSEPTISAQESLKSKVVAEYNGKQYYVHVVQKRQSLSDIAEIYGVSVYEILKENKDLKKTPKSGTIIRIPYKEPTIETEIEYETDEFNAEISESEENVSEYEESYVPMSFDSDRLYKVALMMPLYLEQVDDDFLEEEISNKQLLAKPFSYLHFYEGFMIAVDSMVTSLDMKIDLKVYDVDQDTSKINAALNDSWLLDVDIIVGPFHLKAFEKTMEFAAENDILIINPMTNKDEVVINNRNVVKVKPSYYYQMHWLENVIKDKYTDNNVFIFTMDTNNMDYARMIENIVSRNINEYSLVPNKHIKKVVKKHQDAWKSEEVKFNANEYKSDNMKLDVSLINKFPDDSTRLKNQIKWYNYSVDSLNGVKKTASSIRNNLFVVFGDGKVFATEMLNKINILTKEFPSSLIALPDWSKYDNLFNENLMKLNTIVFDDEYTDYNSYSVGKFICKFRDTYGTEPKETAYHGFNVAWYFLNALINYGDDVKEGIETYSIPLLNTTYSFDRRTSNDGLENTYWNVYQYQDYSKRILRYE